MKSEPKDKESERYSRPALPPLEAIDIKGLLLLRKFADEEMKEWEAFRKKIKTQLGKRKKK